MHNASVGPPIDILPEKGRQMDLINLPDEGRPCNTSLSVAIISLLLVVRAGDPEIRHAAVLHAGVPNIITCLPRDARDTGPPLTFRTVICDAETRALSSPIITT